MDPFVALDLARAEFERRLDAVTPDQWGRPTPCTDWDVRQLVQHLVAGNRMAVLLLAGAGREDAISQIKSDLIGDDPRREFRRSAEEQAAALGEPGALERICHHPAGDVPGRQLLGFRIGDTTLHAWDLARAISYDEQLDPELVEEVYSSMSPMAPFIGSIGVFGEGPSGDVDESAPMQQRLLDLAGRRP
jgi:uncharacterized protein (TIGR03086 family)